MDVRPIRAKLIRWYERVKRDLPWRSTRDPYAIWISEIMLQQTRVAAVIPYYQRFLQRFPTPAILAAAAEPDLLAMWSGLGYYSRARNLQKAAAQIVALGKFPREFAALRGLAGIGDYTAAAVASIAFNGPHAAVDGNVKRVIARLINDGGADYQHEANTLLDLRDPGRWNQALMELGATVCLPTRPRCDGCPLAQHCEARRQGTAAALPPKRVKPSTIRLERTLIVARRKGRILLTPGTRVPGFWDLPEPFSGARLGATLGEFRHMITHRSYRFVVREATTVRAPKPMRWFPETGISGIPLSTIARKALKLRNAAAD